MYILSRWRKNVRKCYNKESQLWYAKFIHLATEVVDIVVDDESSYKFVVDWIDKTLKDLLKQICCASVEKKIVTSEVSCDNNNVERVINGPIEGCRKSCPHCLRK